MQVVSVSGEVYVKHCAQRRYGMDIMFYGTKIILYSLVCKLVRANENKILSKVMRWSSRRRKGWCVQINTSRFITSIDEQNRLYNKSVTTKTAMIDIKKKLQELDNEEWTTRLFNDKHNNNNGNKLRTYRLYKQHLYVEPYIKANIPRSHRQILSSFRNGALPLAIETGRYSRPPTPVMNRVCKLCDKGETENEIHFLMTCPLFSDFRYDLFLTAHAHIDNFNKADMMSNFINILNCSTLQTNLANMLYKSYQRRKRFV